MTREEAIQHIAGLHYEEDFPYTDTIADFVKERNEAIDMAIEALKADTVEVVRCKDCRHRIYDEYRCLYYCLMYYGQGDVSDDNFCQWGAKMDGGAE